MPHVRDRSRRITAEECNELALVASAIAQWDEATLNRRADGCLPAARWKRWATEQCNRLERPLKSVAKEVSCRWQGDRPWQPAVEDASAFLLVGIYARWKIEGLDGQRWLEQYQSWSQSEQKPKRMVAPRGARGARADGSVAELRQREQAACQRAVDPAVAAAAGQLGLVADAVLGLSHAEGDRQVKAAFLWQAKDAIATGQQSRLQELRQARGILLGAIAATDGLPRQSCSSR